MLPALAGLRGARGAGGAGFGSRAEVTGAVREPQSPGSCSVRATQGRTLWRVTALRAGTPRPRSQPGPGVGKEQTELETTPKRHKEKTARRGGTGWDGRGGFRMLGRGRHLCAFSCVDAGPPGGCGTFTPRDGRRERGALKASTTMLPAW